MAMDRQSAVSIIKRMVTDGNKSATNHAEVVEMTRSMVERTLVNSFVFALGVIILIPSLYRFSAFVYHHINSTTINGVVVDKGMGRTIGCRPNIQYSDSNGTSHEFKTKIIYHFFVCPEKDEKVKILYREGMPEKTIVASYFYHVFLSSLFILTGLYLIYMGGRGKLK